LGLAPELITEWDVDAEFELVNDGYDSGNT
jgi:hypothetical protein